MGHGIHDHLGPTPQELRQAQNAIDTANAAMARVSAASQHALEGEGKKDMTWTKPATKPTRNFPLRIATIIMPNTDPLDGGYWGDKKLAERRVLEREILDQFGGFTTDHVEGYWKDETGKVHFDRSTRYSIAMEDHGSNMLWLEDFARRVAVWGHQLAVAITYPNGAFRIVDVCSDN